MDNQKQKKRKSVMDTLSATMVLVLIALLLVFVGYTYLARQPTVPPRGTARS